MAVAAHALDDYRIPGVDWTIQYTLDTIYGVCLELNPQIRCHHVHERLGLVYSELQKTAKSDDSSEAVSTYGKLLTAALQLLRTHASRKRLSRLASERWFAQQLQSLHAEIDALFALLDLPSQPPAWKEQWGEDEKTQRDIKQKQYTDAAGLWRIASELKGKGLVQAVLELKFEIEVKTQENSPEHVALMRQTLEWVLSAMKTSAPAIPAWFIPSYDVYCPERSFGVGSFGTVHRGTWGLASPVVVKRLLTSGNEVFRRQFSAAATVGLLSSSNNMMQSSFVSELERWSQLDHPHVFKLYGGNHVASPMFFVSEDATASGNFAEYFREAENKQRLWRLFYEVALGLHYLHKNEVAHGNLKCNNLLVSQNGLAKISDFGFSVVRSKNTDGYRSGLAFSTRWKALESLGNDTDTASDSTFDSDVYSLGMCITEAVTGDVPWGAAVDDDTILGNLLEGIAHPRPDGLFTDKQWQLVSAMCAIDVNERVKLSDAIEMLKDFADEENRKSLLITSP